MSERNHLGLPSMTFNASVGEASGVDQGRFCADLDGLPQNIDRVLSRNRNEDRVDRSTDICESAIAPDSVNLGITRIYRIDLAREPRLSQVENDVGASGTSFCRSADNCDALRP